MQNPFPNLKQLTDRNLFTYNVATGGKIFWWFDYLKYSFWVDSYHANVSFPRKRESIRIEKWIPAGVYPS